MSFDFYFAGATTPRIRDALIRLNANVLKSYVTDKSQIVKFFDAKKHGWQGKLMIDNGAFTLHRQGGSVDIDEYIQWINHNDSCIDFAIALDHIPGKWRQVRTFSDYEFAAQKTWENYMYMVERVKSPEKLLPVFHNGSNLKYLERILSYDKLNYLCLAGRKDVTHSEQEDFYQKCFSVIDKLRPDIRVHCLGSAVQSDVEKFGFTSMDSTSCNMIAANGNIIISGTPVYVGAGLNSLNYINSRIKDIIVSRCEEYGISIDSICSDYQSRCIFNIMYMFELSKSVNYVGNRIGKKKLF